MTVHQFPVRVYYEDTDAGGVVYHTNYLKYFERARTEWLRSLGLSQARLAKEEGLIFTVVELDTAFHRPARLDDSLVVCSTVAAAGRVAVLFSQEIRRDSAEGERLASGNVKVACIDAAAFRPRRLPDWLIEELA
ncbi:MAG: tol-pal system-associated acyl-CoA thioesterase [Pseudomonadota bacterium]|jgi:acyl-CoA thioester hydrolase